MTTGDLPALASHVTWGAGSIHELPTIVRELGARRVLLVTGRRSFEASGAAAVLPELERVATVRRWSDFRPNTDAEDLAVGLRVLAEVDADLVVAIGGGSAMDMAKLLSGYGGSVDPDDVGDAIGHGTPIATRRRGLVLAPTTSGSGAETTHFAVVYTGLDKHSIASPALLPDRIVLDPSLTGSSTPYQRATSGIDAVCQAIESLWAVGGTAASRTDARGALRLLLPDIEAAVNAPTEGSLAAMSLGSHLAGRAIDVSKTTAAHALSYGLTKRHGISHGHAVAVSLGPFLARHAAVAGTGLQAGVDPEAHAAIVAEVLAALGVDDGEAAHHAFAALLRRIGLEPRATRLGITDVTQREELARSVNLERLGNDPVRWSTDHLVEVLTAAG
jgi:alcohol dehydrogenase